MRNMTAADSIPESEILKPKNSALVDDNEWPEFLVTHVKIIDSEYEELTSLLRAREDNPLKLIGKLAKPTGREESKHLLKPQLARSLPAFIEVSDITRFCYGENDDGEAILWAAGAAGWFKIEPSRAYREIHKESSEAINVLYFLSDLFRELKGRKLKATPTEFVFREYAAEGSHDCSDEEEAEAVFLKHKDFLLHCMDTGKEGIIWKNTKIYEWLQIADQAIEDSDKEVKTPRAMEVSDSDRPSTRRAGKGKTSSLRPRSSKHSQKGIRRRYSADEEDPDDTPTGAGAKRKAADDGTLEPRKRSGGLGHSQDIAMMSPSESEANEPVADEAPLPLRDGRKVPSKETSTREPILRIIEQQLPMFEPNGPGGSWLCSFNGCSHVVYNADNPDNRELIREHYRWHAVEKQAQLDLICAEERPYLPVNNLIRRIRELAAQHKSAEPEPTADSAYPEPIQRRY